MTVKVSYSGAELELPKFLGYRFPLDLPLHKWPTFCGAGEGIGDKLIPDHICGVNVSCVCFGHDIGWIICENNYTAFTTENLRFYLNLRSLVAVNANKNKYSRFKIEWRCLGYFLGVQFFGWACFKKSYTDTLVTSDPFTHPGVKAKMHKLAMVNWGIEN